jgi:hypothetical protein
MLKESRLANLLIVDWLRLSVNKRHRQQVMTSTKLRAANWWFYESRATHTVAKLRLADEAIFQNLLTLLRRLAK